MGRGGASGLLARADQAATRAGGHGPGRCLPPQYPEKRPDYNPAMSEQKEALRKAEASLQDAEKRLVLVRKWQPKLRNAVLEYHASVQRLKDLAAGDVLGGVNLLTRIIDAVEAYLQVAPPSGLGLGAESTSAAATAPVQFVSIAISVMDQSAAALEAEAAARAEAEAKALARGEATVAVDPTPPTDDDASTDDPPTHSL